MRKSKWSVAVLAALSLSVALSTAAHGAVFQSQALDMSVASGKQDKKKRGPVKSLVTDVITDYTNTPPAVPDRYATNTKLYFPGTSASTPGVCRSARTRRNSRPARVRTPWRSADRVHLAATPWWAPVRQRWKAPSQGSPP